MSELMQSVVSLLDRERVTAMSEQLGTSPQQTERAIAAALPLLIGQMARNSARPDGADALQGALERDHAGIDPGALLGAILGGGGGGSGGGALGSVLGGGQPGSTRRNDPVDDGRSILGHVFGQKQQRVANGVGQLGGISGSQSSRLMAMLAPIVMAALSRMMQNRGGGGGNALGGLLGGEERSLGQAPGAGGLLGAVLDRDGDGDVDLTDLMRNGQLLGGLFGKR